MGVNHCGSHVGVPEQLLNRADVIALFQKMRGKGVPQGVRAGWLRDVGLEPHIFDGLLENRFVEVAAAPLFRHPGDIVA